MSMPTVEDDFNLFTALDFYRQMMPLGYHRHLIDEDLSSEGTFESPGRLITNPLFREQRATQLVDLPSNLAVRSMHDFANQMPIDFPSDGDASEHLIERSQGPISLRRYIPRNYQR